MNLAANRDHHPQCCQPMPPVSITQSVPVNLMSKNAQSLNAHSNGNFQKQSTKGVGGVVILQSSDHGGKKDSSRKKTCFSGVHSFACAGPGCVCPEMFGGSIRPLGLPFLGIHFPVPMLPLGTFWSSWPVRTRKASPLTHLILIHCTSSVTFLYDLNSTKLKMFIQ